MGPLILGWICLALVSLVSGGCPDSCERGFGSPGTTLSVTETGSFYGTPWNTISKTDFTEQPTIKSGDLKEYFEVTSDDEANTWLLKVMDPHFNLPFYRSPSGLKALYRI